MSCRGGRRRHTRADLDRIAIGEAIARAIDTPAVRLGFGLTLGLAFGFALCVVHGFALCIAYRTSSDPDPDDPAAACGGRAASDTDTLGFPLRYPLASPVRFGFSYPYPPARPRTCVPVKHLDQLQDR